MVVRGMSMRLATMFRESRPIYSRDAVEYQRAFQEAEVLYEEWLESRKDQVGLQLFAIRKSKKESAYAIRSQGDEG